MKAASTKLILLPINLVKRKIERREDGGGRGGNRKAWLPYRYRSNSTLLSPKGKKIRLANCEIRTRHSQKWKLGACADVYTYF